MNTKKFISFFCLLYVLLCVALMTSGCTDNEPSSDMESSSETESSSDMESSPETESSSGMESSPETESSSGMESSPETESSANTELSYTTYSDSNYGFIFTYPDTWELEVDDKGTGVSIQNPDNTCYISLSIDTLSSFGYTSLDDQVDSINFVLEPENGSFTTFKGYRAYEFLQNESGGYNSTNIFFVVGDDLIYLGYAVIVDNENDVEIMDNIIESFSLN